MNPDERTVVSNSATERTQYCQLGNAGRFKCDSGSGGRCRIRITPGQVCVWCEGGDDDGAHGCAGDSNIMNDILKEYAEVQPNVYVDLDIENVDGLQENITGELGVKIGVINTKLSSPSSNTAEFTIDL